MRGHRLHLPRRRQPSTLLLYLVTVLPRQRRFDLRQPFEHRLDKELEQPFHRRLSPRHQLRRNRKMRPSQTDQRSAADSPDSPASKRSNSFPLRGTVCDLHSWHARSWPQSASAATEDSRGSAVSPPGRPSPASECPSTPERMYHRPPARVRASSSLAPVFGNRDAVVPLPQNRADHPLIDDIVFNNQHSRTHAPKGRQRRGFRSGLHCAFEL